MTTTLANQAQSNYANANQANLGLGIANLATGLGRSAFDAYRYYNQPTSTPYTGVSGSIAPATSYYPDASMNWTYLD